MSERLAPWWERGWRDWWANQQTTLSVEDPGGTFRYDRSTHQARWRGKLAATGGRWTVDICWGQGTPFFPPLIYPDGVFSRYHQLRDGALCLAPPEFTEVLEIDEWLNAARHWFDRYVREGWGVAREDWSWIALWRPDPGYRLHEQRRGYILLPDRWNPEGTHGELRACVPRGKGGLWVLRSWRTVGAQRWEHWSQGASYVTPGKEEVSGGWHRKGSARAFGAQLVNSIRRRQRHLTALEVTHDDGSRGWDFVLCDPHEDREAFRQILSEHPDIPVDRAAAMLIARQTERSIIRGLPMRSNEMTVRTQLSRKKDDDARIRGGAVVLAGLGALGSEVAHLLAKEQVGQFVLLDGDVLLPGNIARHRLGLSAVGGNKAEQMRVHIQQNHPAAAIRVIPAMLDESLAALDLPERAVLLGLTGHIPSERVLSAIAADRRLPCLHGWLEDDGQLLRLLRTIPGHDPPLHALRELPPLPWPVAETQATECSDLVLPGTESNIHAAANLIVRGVLDLLCERTSSENHVLFAPDGYKPPCEAVPTPLRQRFGILTSRLS